MFDSAPIAIQRAHDEWINLLDRHEAQLRPPVERAIRRAFARAAHHVTEDRIETELRETFHSLFTAHYRRVIRTFANWALRRGPMSGKSYADWERKGIVEDIVARAANWITAHGFEMSKLAAETIMSAIRRVLVRAVTLSERDAADRIQDELARQGKLISRNRARTIARMETTNAADAGIDAALEQHQADGVPILGKQWVTAGDERVRPTHRAVIAAPGDAFVGGSTGEGEDQFTPPAIDEPVHTQTWPKVRWGGKFVVGGFLADRPRDPSLPLHEKINCRCMQYVLTDIDN